ncbi:hypothetical protein ASPWEDRAFT_43925 [Aspergillus wentii DTO 134E9]|uniref:C2H2-type domain-containing protein n=1 Tax=Aspergillus wentii DTO 134E9 TaxID=1073089 RepID=A0A1L9RAF4_ASPWE|nr:uncharacterized protein ASPWEDRAFT_43925 [Aspergillus wentii DTO 134E9]OJJ31901.1 hypothetical protein ASPWEDRAFT_43925 [Aspergillus wentii DTO 134E9]
MDPLSGLQPDTQLEDEGYGSMPSSSNKTMDSQDSSGEITALHEPLPLTDFQPKPTHSKPLGASPAKNSFSNHGRFEASHDSAISITESPFLIAGAPEMNWHRLDKETGEPSSAEPSPDPEVHGLEPAAEGCSEDEKASTGTEPGSCHRAMNSFKESPKAVLHNSTRLGPRDSPLSLPTPTEISSEYDIPKSDSGTTDSGDSAIYGESDSIFGGDEQHVPLEESLSPSMTHQLKMLYANCLFWLIYRQVTYTRSRNGTGSANNTPCRSQFSSSRDSRSRSTSKGKRKADQISGDRGSNEDKNDDDDDDDDDRFDPSQPVKKPRSLEPAPRRFACPFFKRHPNSFKLCGMSDHETPSRVKFHINRKHKPPIYCPRCSAVFKYERERDSHVRDNSCSVKPQIEWICATAEKLRMLGRRSKGRTDIDKWNEIYGILFPGDKLPESPYLDSTESAEVNIVREAFLDGAPAAVRTAIQYAIPQAMRGVNIEEFDRLMYTTHAQVFHRVLSERRQSQFHSPQQSGGPLLYPSFYSESTVEASDSGIAGSDNADKEDTDGDYSPSDSQKASKEPIGGTGAENEEIFSNLNSFTVPPDHELEQMALQHPFECWDFNQPDYIFWTVGEDNGSATL